MIEVNLWAVLLATLSSMVVGSIWYTPAVFGKKWEKWAKVNPKQMGNGTRAIIVTVVVSFVTAFVLAHVTAISHAHFQNAPLQDALATALWVWAGFTAARFITHDAFEGRPFKLTVLNITHELVTLLVMALIIGLLPK